MKRTQIESESRSSPSQTGRSCDAEKDLVGIINSGQCLNSSKLDRQETGALALVVTYFIVS